MTKSSRLDQLLAFLDEDPTDAFVQFALASEYVKLGNPSEAIRRFELLRENNPQYVGLYYHLGKTLESCERTPEALAVYRAGIQVATSQSDLHARAELQSALLEAEMTE